MHIHGCDRQSTQWLSVKNLHLVPDHLLDSLKLLQVMKRRECFFRSLSLSLSVCVLYFPVPFAELDPSFASCQKHASCYDHIADGHLFLNIEHIF
jgi:hypothetical protein